ncbi:Flp pilus assembly complex ATPase component TadA [Gluconacetobacter diazotrophicus]|uniref:Flp pilus assembly complex ATPase component TadA n=1 Tax=Gluconacetobacter diazotrophicus TaxID=33996 RepID=A0A7W4FF57_GLUDI|nr:Flp pilus assembly complex ATPase component TadA [Gluconacetobacter diazotrophicus]
MHRNRTAENGRVDPPGVRLHAEDAQHIFIDEANAIAYLDEAKRNVPIYQQWLTAHERLPDTHNVYSLSFVPLGEVNRRREDAFRAASGTSHSAGDTSHVRGRAITLLRVAARCGATDIHILRRKSLVQVQFRIRKSLFVYGELSTAEGDALIIALYRLCAVQDNMFMPAETQDGAIAGDVLEQSGLSSVRVVRGPAYPVIDGGGHMELRLQTTEKSRGLKIPADVNLRPLPPPPGELRLAEYGFSELQINKILYAAAALSGAIIVTGPTGSGKNTTNFEVSRWQAQTRPDKRTIEIGQPIEYPMPWAVQLEVSNAHTEEIAGKLFLENFRYSLRMDPDRLIVSEIRGAEIALTMYGAAQTGHQVLTTMHVDDPFDFPLRLQGMDYERLAPRVTCNSSIIRCVIAQRLVPHVCPHCSLPWDESDARLPRMAIDAFTSWGDVSKARMVRPGGCERCEFMGVHHVSAVAEVVLTDEELMNDIISKGVAVARRRYRSRDDADTSMVEKAIRLALAGTIDPMAIVSEVGQIPFRDHVELDRRRGRAERMAAAKAAAQALQLADGELFA